MRLPPARNLVRGDVVIGVILIAVAIWYGREAQTFRPGRSGDPGAGMFPTLLALLLGGLALWMIVSALIDAVPTTQQTSTDRAAARAGFFRAAAVAGLTVALLFLFEPVGYLIATAAYAAAISLLFRRDTPWLALVAAASAVAFVHILFAVLLNARLPMGLLA